MNTSAKKVSVGLQHKPRGEDHFFVFKWPSPATGPIGPRGSALADCIDPCGSATPQRLRVTWLS